MDVVRRLTAASGYPVVIVDDGSGPAYRDVFTRVAELPGVRVLRHAVNLGKGAALKTAMNHVLCALSAAIGIVTADADGQHHSEDVLRVAEALASNPEALLLGCRGFDRDVPLRSRFGNVLTRGVMHALLGRNLTDTQTGLRGIPAAFLPTLLRLETGGYEFELEMLIAAHQFSLPLVEVPIRTIYEPGNRPSHFNPHRRLDEDLLRPAAIRVRVAAHRPHRQLRLLCRLASPGQCPSKVGASRTYTPRPRIAALPRSLSTEWIGARWICTPRRSSGRLRAGSAVSIPAGT